MSDWGLYESYYEGQASIISCGRIWTALLDLECQKSRDSLLFCSNWLKEAPEPAYGDFASLACWWCFGYISSSHHGPSKFSHLQLRVQRQLCVTNFLSTSEDSLALDVRRGPRIDDVVWDETRESDDHIVPDTEDTREGTCMVKVEHRKRSCCETANALTKSAEQKPVGNKNVVLREKGILSCSSTKDEPSTQLLDMDPWCDLRYEKQATTYNLMHVDAGMGTKSADDNYHKDVKQESAENDLIIEICKEDPILEKGDSILGDRDENLVNNSSHFSLSDIHPPEVDLEFFGNENEDKESCTLLDYGWENIGNFEDMDRLLRSCESTFGHAVNSSVDELLWPSSSSDCFDSLQGNIRQGRAAPSPESRALKGKSQQNEQKMEFMPCDYPPVVATCQIDDSIALDCQENNSISITDKPLKQESSGHIQELQANAVNENKCSWGAQQRAEHNGRSKGTPISQKDYADTSQDNDKVNSYRKLAVGHKQPEKKHKKHLSDKNNMQNLPPVISYSTGFQVQQSIFPKLQTSASSALQIFPSPVHASHDTGSLRQVYPQFPYIHAGYGYPLYHVPTMPYLSNLRPQADQGQQLFGGYQIPADVSNQPQHLRKPSEIPLRPPSMTPQEKIEKLRWRQQMQARLAVEHQQQQFVSQKASMGHSPVHKQPKTTQHQQAEVIPKEGLSKLLQSSSAESDSLTLQENSSAVSGLTYSEDDGSLEANVLHQLQNVITRLDMKTRSCIRDSLYRLARSAMERRCVGDTKTSSENSDHILAVGMCTSINTDQTQANRCIGPNDMETGTNPFDRTIAHFLFHKHSMPSAGPLTVDADFSNSSFSMNPQTFSATPNLWLCLPTAFESPAEVKLVPTTNLQLPIPGQSPTAIATNGVGCGPHNMINMKGSSSGASDDLFNPRIRGTPASMDLENTEGIFLSKHQVVPQNNDSICLSDTCIQLTHRGTILDNNEGMIELKCQLSENKGDGKIFPPSTQNMVKQESLGSLEVDMLNTDSEEVDVLNTNSAFMTSEQFSEIGGTKKRCLSK